MTFRYLRNDADIEAGRGVPAVVAREGARCLGHMARAASRAMGLSRLHAPYWTARHFAGLLGTPLDSSTLIRQRWRIPGGDHADIVLRANQSDLTVLKEVFLNRCYELPAECGGRLRTIVDIGANCGLASAYLAARHRPDTLVAVEPLAENVQVLRHNAARADARWRIEECAAAATTEPLDFYISGYWCTATAVESVGRRRLSLPHRIEQAMPRELTTVPADTVAAILERHRIEHVDLMKIDIEGGELPLLTDRPDWLHRVDRVLIEIHDKYIDGDAVRDALRAGGLRQYTSRHLSRSAPPGMSVELHVRPGRTA